MSEVTKEDVKNAAMKIAGDTGSNDVSYADLQKELDKLALGKLDGLVRGLLEDEPAFGEVDDKGTAKKSDDELILKIAGSAEAAPKKEAAKEKPKKEGAAAKETKKAKKKVATKKAAAKKDAKAKGKEAQKGLLDRIKGWFGR